jgi:hypothetical protein
MAYIRITILLLGLKKADVDAGLNDLMDEFRHRPWLINPNALWDIEQNGLVVKMDYEGHDVRLCSQAALDEVRNCVIACLQFSSDLKFEILDSRHTSVA